MAGAYTDTKMHTRTTIPQHLHKHRSTTRKAPMGESDGMNLPANHTDNRQHTTTNSAMDDTTPTTGDYGNDIHTSLPISNPQTTRDGNTHPNNGKRSSAGSEKWVILARHGSSGMDYRRSNRSRLMHGLMPGTGTAR